MDNIKYLWNFKPNEKNDIPKEAINNNNIFVKNYDIITPDKIEELIKCNKDVFPDLLELYNMIPHWVSKCDLGRLLVIYFHGGLYSDIDCFIVNSLNQHNDNHNILLFIEHIASIKDLGPRECKNTQNALRVANFFFGSRTVKHPFIKELINECINRMKQLFIIEKINKLSIVDILWLCGPDVITSVYHKSKDNYNDIFLYSNKYLQHRCYGSWR